MYHFRAIGQNGLKPVRFTISKSELVRDFPSKISTRLKRGDLKEISATFEIVTSMFDPNQVGFNCEDRDAKIRMCTFRH
jgi:hypothetical protein